MPMPAHPMITHALVRHCASNERSPFKQTCGSSAGVFGNPTAHSIQCANWHFAGTLNMPAGLCLPATIKVRAHLVLLTLIRYAAAAMLKGNPLR